MKLTLAIHPVTEMRFGAETKLSGTRLEINKEELRKHVMEDKRVIGVDLEIVRPGESCRMGMVFDVVEPRAKEPGSGTDFPGILSAYQQAGNGTTHVLRGAAVTALDEGREAPAGASRRGSNRVLEMSGPAAEASPYGHLQHLVITARTREDTEWHVSWNAMRVAVVKSAVYLAKASLGHRPATTEIYESEGPVTTGRQGLPRIAFLGQIHSGHHGTETDEHIIYGHNGLGMLPVPLHPNEWLDGALVTSYTHLGGGDTYFYQNNPIITSLYKKHQAGELTFVGAVAIISPGVDEWRARNCMVASSIAKWLLKADGVVLTRYFAGQPHSDMFETARQCEVLGMKTVCLSADSAGDGRVESVLLMNLPEVQAVVVNGSAREMSWRVPAAERVIAGNPAVASKLAAPQELSAGSQAGVTNQQGASKVRSIVY